MNDPVIVDISGNIIDPDGDDLLNWLVGDPGNGTLNLNPDGTYTYEPDTGYTGPDSFTFSATDGEIGAPAAQASVTITIGNTLPTATNESVETNMNIPVSGTVGDNIQDLDGDPLTTGLFSGPSHGTLTLNPDGSYTYQPGSGFVGDDSFIYSASDGESGVLPAYGTVSIKVIGDTTPPPPMLPEQASSTKPPSSPGVEQLEGAVFDNLVWLAMELGLCQGDEKSEDEKQCQEITQAYLAGAFLQATDLQPHKAATRLRELVATLHDTDGSQIAALSQVVAEFVAGPVPSSPEHMASIATALETHSNDGTHYTSAGEWLDALAEYVTILNTEIGWPADESIAFAMNKYGTTITEAGEVSVLAFIQMHLEGLGGS